MTVLVLFLMLTIKHAICDLYLQSYLDQHSNNKGQYLGAWKHYLEHTIGTLVVLIFFVDWPWTALLAFADGIAHWHIDWAKHRTLRWYESRTGVSMDQHSRNNNWLVQAVDQMLHFATYFILCLIVLGLN